MNSSSTDDESGRICIQLQSKLQSSVSISGYLHSQSVLHSAALHLHHIQSSQVTHYKHFHFWWTTLQQNVDRQGYFHLVKIYAECCMSENLLKNHEHGLYHSVMYLGCMVDFYCRLGPKIWPKHFETLFYVSKNRIRPVRHCYSGKCNWAVFKFHQKQAITWY